MQRQGWWQRGRQRKIGRQPSSKLSKTGFLLKRRLKLKNAYRISRQSDCESKKNDVNMLPARLPKFKLELTE